MSTTPDPETHPHPPDHVGARGPLDTEPVWHSVTSPPTEPSPSLEQPLAGPPGATTAILDRPDAAHTPDAARTPDAGDQSSAGNVALPVAIVVAALTAAGGAIHFGMTPQHAAEWHPEGLAFGIFGAVQFALAAWLLATRRRSALLTLAAVNVVGVLAWAWSRTLGMPFGPDKGSKESVEWLDLLTVTAEALAAMVAAVTVDRLDQRHTVRAGRFGGLTSALAVAALIGGGTASLLASPAGQHHHDDESASAAGATGAASTGHGHGSAGEGAAGEGAAAGSATLANLSLADRDQLATELAKVRSAATRYPTVADAEAAGMTRAGPYAAGSGAHYFQLDTVQQTTFDPAKPAALLYSGTNSDSRVVGAMYYLNGDTAPEGFTGEADVWHQHGGACFKITDKGIEVPLPVDADIAKADCDAVPGAQFIDQTGWMVHVWAVPGWDSPDGVFAHDNAELVCADGSTTVENLATGCEGR